MSLKPAVNEVAVRLETALMRVPRASCAVCMARRVLYRIVVASPVSTDFSEARCAKCWGVR
jgi:hypothetical protein